MMAPIDYTYAFLRGLTLLHWISFGITTWAIIAYRLWVSIPETPRYSKYKAEPRVWWKALLWPGYFTYYVGFGVVLVVYYIPRGIFEWAVLDPIKERRAYGKEVETDPYTSTYVAEQRRIAEADQAALELAP